MGCIGTLGIRAVVGRSVGCRGFLFLLWAWTTRLLHSAFSTPLSTCDLVLVVHPISSHHHCFLLSRIASPSPSLVSYLARLLPPANRPAAPC